MDPYSVKPFSPKHAIIDLRRCKCSLFGSKFILTELEVILRDSLCNVFILQEGVI